MTDYSKQWTKEENSDAQKRVKDCCEGVECGMDFRWEDGLDVEKTFLRDGDVAYTFFDGSRIIAGSSWSYGVHRDLLAKAEVVYDEEYEGENEYDDRPEDAAKQNCPEACNVLSSTAPYG